MTVETFTIAMIGFIAGLVVAMLIVNTVNTFNAEGRNRKPKPDPVVPVESDCPAIKIELPQRTCQTGLCHGQPH